LVRIRYNLAHVQFALRCFSDRDPVRRKTRFGALRCTPGSVANPLNRLGRFIAAFESGPVVIRQGVSLKSGAAFAADDSPWRLDEYEYRQSHIYRQWVFPYILWEAIKSPLNGGLI
jgi:hypothetical protein